MKVHNLRVIVSAFVDIKVASELSEDEVIELVKDNTHISDVYFTTPVSRFGVITQRPTKVKHNGINEIEL
jgi:hypothetical protein